MLIIIIYCPATRGSYRKGELLLILPMVNSPGSTSVPPERPPAFICKLRLTVMKSLDKNYL